MEIMERGLNPNHFKGQSDFSPLLLVLGIISIGIAIGIMAGIWLSTLYPSHGKSTTIFCILLGLGLALISAYAMLKKRNRE